MGELCDKSGRELESRGGMEQTGWEIGEGISNMTVENFPLFEQMIFIFRRSETDVISDIQDSMNLTPSGIRTCQLVSQIKCLHYLRS